MKKAAAVLIVVLAVIAGGVFWAYFSLDLIVKYTLEHYGPQVAGVSVHVAEVKISPRDGKGRLRGVDIGNPNGFAAAHAARFGEINVAVDPATIGEPLVIIHEIVVQSPLITYERANKGTNLDAIQRKMEGYIARADEASKGGSSSSPPVKHKFVIGRFAIRGARVIMTNTALRGQGITFDLPDIELRDIGKRQDGVTASQAANIVINTLIARIGQKVLTNIDLLRKGGVEGAIDALKGLIR